MSIIQSIKQVLGLSGTASENHFWDGSIPNILSLKRGIPSAPGAEVININAGQVSAPNQVTPTFIAEVTSSGTATGPVNIGGIVSVTTNIAGTWATNKYTPQKAGYYLVAFDLGAQMGTSLFYNALSIRKNGVSLLTNVGTPYATMYSRTLISGLVYMNGTTDYLEFYQDILGTGAPSVLSGFIHARHLGEL